MGSIALAAGTGLIVVTAATAAFYVVAYGSLSVPAVSGFEAFDRLDRLERLLTEFLSRPVHVVTARHDSDFTRRVLRDAVGL